MVDIEFGSAEIDRARKFVDGNAGTFSRFSGPAARRRTLS